MGGVEPHESEQPVEANASEQVGDLCRWAVLGAAAVSAISIGA